MHKKSLKHKKIDNVNVPYVYTSYPRQKHVRFRVRDGVLKISGPRLTTRFYVERCIEAQKEWILEQIHKQGPVKNVTIDGSVVRTIYKYFQKVARKDLDLINKFYGFEYGRVSIRSQKTRWGSCSAKGNINLNIKIFALPEHLRRYILVHELCHTEELNHSKNFWDLVAQQCPTYKNDRKELKKYCL